MRSRPLRTNRVDRQRYGNPCQVVRAWLASRRAASVVPFAPSLAYRPQPTSQPAEAAANTCFDTARQPKSTRPRIGAGFGQGAIGIVPRAVPAAAADATRSGAISWRLTLIGRIVANAAFSIAIQVSTEFCSRREVGDRHRAGNSKHGEVDHERTPPIGVHKDPRRGPPPFQAAGGCAPSVD
jgi:hypothetical protein